jgi:hypothetical protein
MSELIDNNSHRIETLEGVIKKLHDGADPESLKDEFGDLLAEVGASEIAAMENSLMADGMAEGEIVLIRSSFQVAPLIDALRGKGHEVSTRKVGGDAWEAWVRKR